MKLLRAFTLLGLLLASHAQAVTWFPTQKVDPIDGQTLRVKVWASYGSYVYREPSRSDLVFFPITEPNWLWFSEDSGYGAFGNDYDKLAPEEAAAIKDWLAQHYSKKLKLKTQVDRLAWVEQIYALRKKDARFWRGFYCLMAYMTREDAARSLGYVNKALPLLEQELAANPQGEARMDVLYLLGEYHRRNGRLEKAQDYFEQVGKVTWTNSKGEAKIGQPYFDELIKERLALGQ